MLKPFLLLFCHANFVSSYVKVVLNLYTLAAANYITKKTLNLTFHNAGVEKKSSDGPLNANAMQMLCKYSVDVVLMLSTYYVYVMLILC